MQTVLPSSVPRNRWRALSDAEKQPYKDEHEELKAAAAAQAEESAAAAAVVKMKKEKKEPPAKKTKGQLSARSCSS